MKRSLTGFMSMAAALVPTVLPATTFAQTFSVDSFHVEPAGGESSGGVFTLVGVVGLTNDGPSSGDGFVVSGNLHAGLTVGSSGGAPVIFIEGSGDGIIVTWEDATAAFVLEATDEPGGGRWSAVEGGDRPPVVISPSGRSRFFRLKRD